MKQNDRIVVIAAMAAFFSLPASARDVPSTPRPVVVKLTSRDDTCPEMPVNINRVKGWLTVDTGAMSTTLNKSQAQDLKVNLEATGRTVHGIGGTSKIMSGEITAYVPGHRFKDFPTLSGKHDFLMEHGEPSANSLGLIGLSELAAAGAVVNCAGSSMTLHPNGNFRRPENSFELPMLRYTGGPNSAGLKAEKLEGNFLWALPVTIAGKQGVMVVDTAAATSMITNSFAKLVGMELGNSHATVSGVGGSQQMAFCALPDLLLGGKLQLGKVQAVSSDFPTLSDVAGGSLPVAGVLGIDQLRRIKAFIDCKRGVIHATRGPLKPNRLNSIFVDATNAIVALAKLGDKEALQIMHSDNEGPPCSLAQALKLIDRAERKGKAITR